MSETNPDAEAPGARQRNPRGLGQILRDVFPTFAYAIVVLEVALALIEGGLFYYGAYFYAPYQNIRLKTADVEMHCNLRWSELFRTRLEIEQMEANSPHMSKASISDAVHEYYRQFWSLQNDQFYYYEEGFLPENLYLDWAQERMNEFALDQPLVGEKFSTGWRDQSQDCTLPPQDFLDFENFLEQNRGQKLSGRLRQEVKEMLRSYSKDFKVNPLHSSPWDNI